MNHDKYYAKGKCVLLDGDEKYVVQFAPYRKYPINSTGLALFEALGTGKTCLEIADILHIDHVDKRVDRIYNFLEHAASKQILTKDIAEAGTMIVRKSPFVPALERLFIEVTRKCNFYCQHCFMSASSVRTSEYELSFGDLESLLHQANEYGVSQVDFTGGEIFVRKDAREILMLASNLGFISNIFTNGYALTKEMCEFLADLGNIKTVYISLDDIDAAAHDSFRGMPGSFNRVLKAIEYLKMVNLHVVVNTTLSRNNVDHILDIIDYCRDKLHVECRVAPVLYVGRGKCLEDQKLDTTLVVETMKYLIGNRKLERNELKANVPNCGVGERMLYICADGEVCLCPTLSSREGSQFYLGNLREDNLKDIWVNSSKLKQFRSSNCYQTNCKYRATCRGGCRSRAYITTHCENGVDQVICDYFSDIEVNCD